MKADEKWTSLGWKHALWDIVRFYLSLRGANVKAKFRETLQNSKQINVTSDDFFPVEKKLSHLFEDYLDHREEKFKQVFGFLRSEEQALSFCSKLQITPSFTATQLNHHQSSKALVATVSAIASKVCSDASIDINSNPQARCVWLKENRLHVSVRNLDGAIPSLFNPKVIWEIKEYWGKTNGGSKMSDAVYECHLVGLEVRTFEEKTKTRISHVVFVDGKEQWSARRSDLNRFIDLLNQGLIDELYVGRMVEEDWERSLVSILAT